ncbi:hypothetical protein [Ekhidna sp.]|uniref:hypothetical protein n=1 Tax=Ekhidna sp. TaxID=2608089 RepID=UPI003C7BB286
MYDLSFKENNISEILRATIFLFTLFISTLIYAQTIGTRWFSQRTTNGITIQNSYPKGGRYNGNVENKFNCSYLVFFTRVINGTDSTLELNINFSSDSIAIPNSPGTFMQLLLPSEIMTLEKQSLFSYGITELASLDKPTSLKRSIKPQEDCLFYVVAFFYQTENGEWSQERGGNRAELVLEGQNLLYRMHPQVPSLSCGHLVFE